MQKRGLRLAREIFDGFDLKPICEVENAKTGSVEKSAAD
jgi:hypothetical protein